MYFSVLGPNIGLVLPSLVAFQFSSRTLLFHGVYRATSWKSVRGVLMAAVGDQTPVALSNVSAEARLDRNVALIPPATRIVETPRVAVEEPYLGVFRDPVGDHAPAKQAARPFIPINNAVR